jgi:hypothetical protein
MSDRTDHQYAKRIATVMLLFMIYGAWEFFREVKRNRQRLEDAKAKSGSPTWVMSDRKCTQYIRTVSGYNVKNITCLEQYQSGKKEELNEFQ